jgi:transcription antitermination factor NusG
MWPMSIIEKLPPVSEGDACQTLGGTLDACTSEKTARNQPEIIKIANGWGGSRPNTGGAREGAGRKPAQRAIQRATGPRWYVIEMFRGQENRIVRDLLEGESRIGYIARPSFEVCQPRIAVEVVRKGQRQVVHQNMFAGYAFVWLDHLCDPWPLVRQVDGVLRIFTTRSINPETGNVTPIPLPIGFVEALIDTAPERLKLAAVRLPSYAPGQMLRVETGPFAASSARCVACDGLTTRVAVHFFGRDVEVVLPRGGLSAAQ